VSCPVSASLRISENPGMADTNHCKPINQSAKHIRGRVVYMLIRLGLD